MSYVLEFEIAGLPKMMNGSHGSHWAASAMRKKWRGMVSSIAKVKRPTSPLEKAKITLTRHSSSCPDFDGLVAGFKSVIDGLKDAGIIADDKLINIGAPLYLWQKAKQKQGKITVKVEGVL